MHGTENDPNMLPWWFQRSMELSDKPNLLPHCHIG